MVNGHFVSSIVLFQFHGYLKVKISGLNKILTNDHRSRVLYTIETKTNSILEYKCPCSVVIITYILKCMIFEYLMMFVLILDTYFLYCKKL